MDAREADLLRQDIWIVSDGNPGHYNQSLAIAEALSRRGGGKVEWVTAQFRVRGFLRPLVTRLLNLTRRPLPQCLERACYRLQQPLPEQPPGLIISSGGKTAFLSVLLSRRLQCRNLFIGLPAKVSFANFKAVLHNEPDIRAENSLAIDYLPARLDPERAQAAGAAFREENRLGERKLCCMLIGGDSRSHKFGSADWRSLAHAMNRLAEKYGFSWLVTSSRRTGREAEDILQAELDPDTVADATWWSEQPRAVVVPYLGASEIAFCTQDSLSMLSEGIAAGRPVYALYPEALTADDLESTFNERFLSFNTEHRRLRRIPIAQLAEVQLDQDVANYFQPVRADLMQASIDKLVTLLTKP